MAENDSLDWNSKHHIGSKKPIREIDLLLIGKTGHGKSSTGNSILGRKVFESSCSTTSVTKKAALNVGMYRNYVFKVMDTPGVADTSEIKDSIVASKLIMEQMKDAVILNPNGYHAFLLVLKFGIRLTKEEVESIRILKQIFGDSFVQKYCIIIITSGDSFCKEFKSKNTSFKKWRHEQEGYFKQLRLECNDRVVLFDNSSNDDKYIHDKQMRKLLKCVKGLKTSGNRYSDKHFEMAKQSRERLLTSAQCTEIDSGLDEMGLILLMLKSIVYYDEEFPRITYNEIMDRCDALANRIPKHETKLSLQKDFLKLISEVKNSSYKFASEAENLQHQLKENDDKVMRETERLSGFLNTLTNGGDVTSVVGTGNVSKRPSYFTSESKRIAGVWNPYADDIDLQDGDQVDRETKHKSCDESLITFEGVVLRIKRTMESDIQDFNSKDLKDLLYKEFESDTLLKQLIAIEKELKNKLRVLNTDIEIDIGKHWNMHTLIKNKCDSYLKTNSSCSIF